MYSYPLRRCLVLMDTDNTQPYHADSWITWRGSFTNGLICQLISRRVECFLGVFWYRVFVLLEYISFVQWGIEWRPTKSFQSKTLLKFLRESLANIDVSITLMSKRWNRKPFVIGHEKSLANIKRGKMSQHFIIISRLLLQLDCNRLSTIIPQLWVIPIYVVWTQSALAVHQFKQVICHLSFPCERTDDA